MKKYAHIVEDKVVTTYEADAPHVFGGPWSEGVSVEIPAGVEIKRAILENGVIIEKPKSVEELASETDKNDKEQIKQLLKGLKKTDIDTVAELRDVMEKLIKVLL